MAVRDTLRFYDQALVDWVSTFTAGTSTNPIVVPVVLASPDRPFGEAKSESEFRLSMMKSNLIVSVTRLDLQFNQRHRVPVPWGTVARDPITNNIVTSEYPRPYLLSYQIDFRSRQRRDANRWIQWVQFTTNIYKVFTIDFGIPWGVKRIDSEVTVLVDNSDLEPADPEGNRFVRHTFTVSLTAFMFLSVDSIDDIPDTYGQLSIERPFRELIVDTYLAQIQRSESNLTLETSQRTHVSHLDRKLIDRVINMPVEA